MSTYTDEKRDPRVSIVLPAYNSARFIGAQIESIRKQAFTDWELIVCDDGSTDETAAVARSYVDGDSRIRVVRNRENMGAVENFANGTRLARGEFIAKCDHDDVCEPDKLLLQVGYMDRNPEVGLVYHDSLVCDEYLRPIGQTMQERFRRRGASDTIDSLLKENHITGHSMLFRRSLLTGMLPFPDLQEDHWAALVAASFSKIGYIDRPLVKYRQHRSNLVGAGQKGPRGHLAEFFSKEFLPEYTHSASCFSMTLQTLLTRLGGRNEDAASKIRAKIACLEGLIRLGGAEGARACFHDLPSAARDIFKSGQWRHFKHLTYLALHKLNPMKR